MKTDLYDLLGLSRDADSAAIKAAYRQKARQYHPDVNADDGAEERFKQVLAAFHILSDPETRATYDEFGFEGLRQGFDPRAARRARQRRGRRPPADSGNDQADAIFSDIFDGRSPFDTSHMRDFGGFDAAVERGQDLSADVTVDFLTAVRGGQATVRLPGRRLSIDVPAGSREADVVEYRGEGGQPTTAAGLPGDLTVTLHVESHRLLRRDGLDLSLDLPVTVAEAVDGATVVVPTPHGDFDVQVPSGVHTGTRLRLADQGVHRRSQVGDFYAVVQVYTPDYVDDEISAAAAELTRGYSDDIRQDLTL